MSIRVRFAPSPTGHLHVGNVRTALFNWLLARQKGGTFILRVEDTDAARSQRLYEEQLCDDLRWLGLDWDEGVDVGGPFGPYRQTDRFDLYRQYAARLLEEGKAYYCFCPAEELERVRQGQMERGEAPHYAGTCLEIDPDRARNRVGAGEAATIRLRVLPGKSRFEDLVYGPIEVDRGVIGDFILLRSDGSAQYNFAVVIDDVSMQISHVIRGEGHISNTHRQLLIYEALHEAPPEFAHLSTILGKDGTKLSKRHGATSIDEFRRQGFLPQALVNYLALLGWSPRQEGHEILKVEELIREFDLARVNRSPAVFDEEKLCWVNRSHLKQIEPSRLLTLALPYLQEQGWIGSDPSSEVKVWLEKLVESLRSYLDTIKDIVETSRLIFEFAPQTDLQHPEVREILSSPRATEVIQSFFAGIQGNGVLEAEQYKQAVQQTKASTGQKGKNLFHPIRVSLTARASGPELDRLIPLIEKGKQLNLPSPVIGARDRVRLVLQSCADASSGRTG